MWITSLLPSPFGYLSLLVKDKFDEDSQMYARLERWAAACDASSVSLMARRRRLFDLETGFDFEGKAEALRQKLHAYMLR